MIPSNRFNDTLFKAVARTSSTTPNSTHKRPPPQPLSVSWDQGFICVHCQALKPQTSECLALTGPSHTSVYPPVNFGRFMQYCVLLLTTTSWYQVLTDTTSSPESTSIHTSQAPVIIVESTPDWLATLARPSSMSKSQHTESCLQYVSGFDAAANTFRTFSSSDSAPHATFLRDHDGFETPSYPGSHVLAKPERLTTLELTKVDAGHDAEYPSRCLPVLPDVV